MKHKIQTLGGYLTDTKSSPGLKNPFFGSPEKPFVQAVGPDGNVIGLVEHSPLRPDQCVVLKLPIVAQAGLPAISAFVQDAAKPQAIDVMYWPDMVSKVLSIYPSMSKDLCKHHPIAGMEIANFVLELAPKWAARSNPVDFERFRPEIDLIAADDEHTFRRSPEVLALAKAAGVDLKPTRRHEMLP